MVNNDHNDVLHQPWLMFSRHLTNINHNFIVLNRHLTIKLNHRTTILHHFSTVKWFFRYVDHPIFSHHGNHHNYPFNHHYLTNLNFDHLETWHVNHLPYTLSPKPWWIMVIDLADHLPLERPPCGAPRSSRLGSSPPASGAVTLEPSVPLRSPARPEPSPSASGCASGLAKRGRPWRLGGAQGWEPWPGGWLKDVWWWWSDDVFIGFSDSRTVSQGIVVEWLKVGE